MQKTSRRAFLGTAAASAATFSLGHMSGCGPQKSEPVKSLTRNHPLDGIERENIKITDIKVIPLSYDDPNKNLWRTATYIVWKTDGAITQVFTDFGEGLPAGRVSWGRSVR